MYYMLGCDDVSDSQPITTVIGGSTYVRWGRTTCGNNSQLLYEGFVIGSHYTHDASSIFFSNCLTFVQDGGQVLLAGIMSIADLVVAAKHLAQETL
ncbi:hypothetical protein EB796_019628 [Bugula neritina]|uniref:Uncharacterized protein n=1 Tax=Bugula neritina TaxID=10212 RepID=A0A7J7J7I5_BUGNE|nr:hypothetical protein EB796_019628 [Bugula neritina]